MQRFIISLLILLASVLINAQAPAIESAEFSGQVVDHDRNPVELAEIFLYTSENIRRQADYISAGTDATGHFRMTLPVGKYWAVARVRKGEKFGPLKPGDKHSGEPDVFELATGQPVEVSFTVADLAESARLNKKTNSDFFRIQGKIVDKKGKPLQPAYAIANRNEARHQAQIADYISAWTNADGRYLLFLPAGKFQLGYSQTFPAERTVASFKEITVTNHMENIDIVVQTDPVPKKQTSSHIEP